MLLSRVRGSLVAGVVGDCIGEMFEGRSRVSVKEVLAYVQKIEKKWTDRKQKEAKGKRPGSAGAVELEFTDDTAMARSIAASLVQHQAVNVDDIAARFAKEFAREPMRGYGGNVMTVLKALGDPNLKDMFEPASKQFDGSGSYGNGGAMRIAPLGLFYYKQPVEQLQEQTISITRLTHSHAHGIVGALLESFAVHLALSLSMGSNSPLDTQDFLHRLVECLRPAEEHVYNHYGRPARCEGDEDEEDSEKGEKLPYCEKLELIKEFLGRDVGTEEVVDKLGHYISALGSVPTAVYCFLKGASKSLPDFQGRSEVEQTILYAISLGGDTDTIATMAGAIAGAFYGLEGVPQSWQDASEGVSDAIMYADKMVEGFTASGRV